MNECLNCQNPVEQKEGRRKRLYCGDTCRVQFNRKKNGKKIRWIEIGKYEKLKAELEQERQSRSNPFINAARGRDENGVNQDEILLAPPLESFNNKKLDRLVLDETGKWPTAKKTIAEQIKDLEDEIASVGPSATTLISYNQKKIKELKRKL